MALVVTGEGRKFFPAPANVVSIMKEVINGCYPDLEEAEILLVLKKAEISSGLDMTNPGKVKKVSEEVKAIVEADFIITVPEERIFYGSNEQKEALFDHLLSYCGYDEDPNTYEKKWKLNKPDVVEFSDVIARRGIWNNQLKQMENAYKQISLFEVEPTVETKSEFPESA